MITIFVTDHQFRTLCGFTRTPPYFSPALSDLLRSWGAGLDLGDFRPPITEEYPYVRYYRELPDPSINNPAPFRTLCARLPTPTCKFHLYLDLVRALEPTIPDPEPLRVRKSSRDSRRGRSIT